MPDYKSVPAFLRVPWPKLAQRPQLFFLLICFFLFSWASVLVRRRRHETTFHFTAAFGNGSNGSGLAGPHGARAGRLRPGLPGHVPLQATGGAGAWRSLPANPGANLLAVCHHWLHVRRHVATKGQRITSLLGSRQVAMKCPKVPDT